jgi:hypothetical protein
VICNFSFFKEIQMRVYGTIEDARTEKPLSGANITLSLGDTVLIENTPSTADGFNFEFASSLLPEESDILTCTVEKEGYKPQVLSHKIVDEDARFDVELIPTRVIKWPRILLIAGIILAALVVLMLIGWGIYHLFFGPTIPGPTVKTFTATPTRTAPGQTVLLKWETLNTRTVYLGDEKVEAVGSKEVKPEETTEFTLKAEGIKGESLVRKKKVIIPPLPEIISFKASPPVINQWDFSVLEWQTANARLVYITDGAGEESRPVTPGETGEEAKTPGIPGMESKLMEQTELNGSAVVTPLETTTYTLVVENSVGVKTKKDLEVKVLLPPKILSFTASEPVIEAGKTVILTWKTENAEQVLLNEERTGTSYSKEVSPAETTTYTLTAKNTVGERQKQITVRVPKPEPVEPEPEPHKPPPPPKINRFLTTPPVIGVGQLSQLSWVTEHAQAVYLNGERVKPVDSRQVFPQQTTGYELKAVNETGTTSWTRTVEVKPARCTIILYELENYTGASEEYTLDSPEIGELDNAVSSVKIIGDCAVRVYSAPNYKGIHQVFTQSIPRLRGTLIGNNNISSLKLVDKYEAGGGN